MRLLGVQLWAKVAARRAAAYRGSPRRAFAPREAEVCVSPLLALAVPLQMDIAALEAIDAPLYRARAALLSPLRLPAAASARLGRRRLGRTAS